MERIEQLADIDVHRLVIRSYERVEKTMLSLGAAALRYGWDWPTAEVLYPRLVRRFRIARAEFVKRANAKGIKPAIYSIAISAGEVDVAT